MEDCGSLQPKSYSVRPSSGDLNFLSIRPSQLATVPKQASAASGLIWTLRSQPRDGGFSGFSPSSSLIERLPLTARGYLSPFWFFDRVYYLAFFASVVSLTMHSSLNRLQAVFGFFTSVALCVAGVAALSVLLFPADDVTSSLDVKNVQVYGLFVLPPPPHILSTWFVCCGSADT